MQAKGNGSGGLLWTSIGDPFIKQSLGKYGDHGNNGRAGLRLSHGGSPGVIPSTLKKGGKKLPAEDRKTKTLSFVDTAGNDS